MAHSTSEHRSLHRRTQRVPRMDQVCGGDPFEKDHDCSHDPLRGHHARIGHLKTRIRQFEDVTEDGHIRTEALQRQSDPTDPAPPR